MVEAGHQVLVETGAGEGSGFSDAQYQESEARSVSTAADAWSADMVVKVKEPQPSEYEFLRPYGTKEQLLAASEHAGLVDWRPVLVTGVGARTRQNR